MIPKKHMDQVQIKNHQTILDVDVAEEDAQDVLSFGLRKIVILN
jgi:hypothetical protein